MNESQLRKLIREELQSIVNEETLNEFKVGDDVYIKKDKKTGTIRYIHPTQKLADVDFGDGMSKTYSLRDLTSEAVVLERKVLFPLKSSFTQSQYKLESASALVDTVNKIIEIVNTDNIYEVYREVKFGSKHTKFVMAESLLWENRDGETEVIKEGLEELLNEEEYDYWRDYKAGTIDKATYDRLVKQFQSRNKRRRRPKGKRVYLDVPYRDKDKLKKKFKYLFWDPDKKSWYYVIFSSAGELPKDLEKYRK